MAYITLVTLDTSQRISHCIAMESLLDEAELSDFKIYDHIKKDHLTVLSQHSNAAQVMNAKHKMRRKSHAVKHEKTQRTQAEMDVYE
jgi:hypothetical protein